MIVGSWDVEILFSKGWPDRSSPVPCYKEKVLGRSRAFCRSTETGKLRFVRSTSTHEPPPMPPSIHRHHRLPVGFPCAVHFRSGATPNRYPRAGQLNVKRDIPYAEPADPRQKVDIYAPEKDPGIPA